MAVTTVTSALAPLSLSADAITYKTVICRKTSNVNFSRAVTREDSDCGSFAATGALQWGGSYEGIVSITPTGASEMSYEDLLGFMVSGATLYVKDQYPTSGTPGTDWYTQGQVVLTNLAKQNENGKNITFSFSFENNGDPDIAP